MQLRQRPKLNFVVVAGGGFLLFFVVLLLIADVNVFVVCCPGITACKFLGIMLLLNFWNCLRDKLKQKCVAVFGISFSLLLLLLFLSTFSWFFESGIAICKFLYKKSF